MPCHYLVFNVIIPLTHRIGDLETKPASVFIYDELTHRIGDLENEDYIFILITQLTHRIGDLEKFCRPSG